MVKIRGKIDLRKKKTLLHALKGIQKIIQENAFEFIQFIHLLNNWGTDTSVSRLNVTNATRDVQRVPVSRLPRAPQQPRHCYATLRVSPSRAPVLSVAHYFQAPATQATLL